MKNAIVAFVLSACCLYTSACASAALPTPTPAASSSHVVPWPIKTRENVDLWLHGFALLQTDTTLVPFFKRGYRDDLTVLKNQANVLTQFDVNIDKLSAGLKQNPSLINAQFVAQYFSSVGDMQAAINRFIAVDGNPRAASSQEEAITFSMLASYFPSAATRSWLALFASGLWDEQAKFYHSYWIQQDRARGNVADSIQSIWQTTMRPRLQRYLNNTQQSNGEILLSLPLDGEGRTLGSASTGGRASVAVTFPDRPSDAMNAIYVLAHELIAPVSLIAINDNTTPAQKRNGYADHLASAAAVRGGLLLLEKFIPEFADGYARYYVSATGRTPSNDPRAQIASLFPLPDAILGSISRQLDTVQGGI
jgi:hypothetical protein